MQTTSGSEVFEGFAAIVAKSLRIDEAQILPGAYLDELGAESLDLIEISMEVESHFNVWLAEKSILDTAAEVFGPGVLERDGYLTAAGRELMLRRMPESDAAELSGKVAVADLRRYFMKVSTWVSMIESLLARTPTRCSECGGALQNSAPLRMKCAECGAEVTLRSGEEINREWVQAYYEQGYSASNGQLSNTQNCCQ
ncbi:MAG TPA: phosphopantetheine-binding protein [Bryobacteraceae bacterium]|nr:phosphopantetheine-binding protein [Bryobacteraceae bacterium]